MTAADFETARAAEPLDSADDAALNSVRAFFDETDPVPHGLIERIQFELTLDALQAEVATLMTLDADFAGVRSSETEAVRSVTFTSESLTTMVTLTPQPDGTVRVDGWASPGAGIRVEVLLSGTTIETHADDDGRFVFGTLPSGLAKFALHVRTATGGSSTVLTPTIEL